MVQTEKLVPEVYRQSRDYQVFLKMWDIVLNTVKFDIENWLDLYDPLTCKFELLPTLADHIGYKYNYARSITENRVIIKTFNKLIRNRGSEVGIKLAMALSLNSTIKELSDLSEEELLKQLFTNLNQLSMIEVRTNYETGTITVSYPNDYSYVFEVNKLGKLIDVVRPVGMYLDVVKSDMVLIGDGAAKALDVTARARVHQTEFDAKVHSEVDRTDVNFGEIVPNELEVE